jgi:NADPH:quinone reductase-like Zn-dependent oxidoreductase
MKAIVTIGTGGYEKLELRDVAVPQAGNGDVLLRVLAAGINNTDINTRLGWYSASVVGSTDEVAGTGQIAERADGGWSGATPFPLIQGTDCCGLVVAIGNGGDRSLLGRRVLVRPCMRKHGFDSLETTWLGSDFDGAFAQFVRVPQGEVFPVACDWSDAELATIPCAYGTAENMLHRAAVRAGEQVLVTGASGGVGSATVQLAKRRGAQVTAVTSADKMDAVRALGADLVLARETDLAKALGARIDIAVDNVAGPGFGAVLRTLRRGGRYVSSGAIAGPLVTLDMRDIYLRDLTLIGSTVWDEPVFPNLVSYIERGEIRPLLAATFALTAIVEAQQAFLRKDHVGNFSLIPPAMDAEPAS